MASERTDERIQEVYSCKNQPDNDCELLVELLPYMPGTTLNPLYLLPDLFQIPLRDGRCSDSYVADEKTQAQKGQVTAQESQTKWEHPNLRLATDRVHEVAEAPWSLVVIVCSGFTQL